MNEWMNVDMKRKKEKKRKKERKKKDVLRDGKETFSTIKSIYHFY